MKLFYAFSFGTLIGSTLVLALTVWSMNLAFIPEEVDKWDR